MATDEHEYLIFTYADRLKAEHCIGGTYIIGGVPYLATKVDEEPGTVYLVMGLKQDPHKNRLEGEVPEVHVMTSTASDGLSARRPSARKEATDEEDHWVESVRASAGGRWRARCRQVVD